MFELPLEKAVVVIREIIRGNIELSKDIYRDAVREMYNESLAEIAAAMSRGDTAEMIRLQPKHHALIRELGELDRAK